MIVLGTRIVIANVDEKIGVRRALPVVVFVTPALFAASGLCLSDPRKRLVFSQAQPI